MGLASRLEALEGRVAALEAGGAPAAPAGAGDLPAGTPERGGRVPRSNATATGLGDDRGHPFWALEGLRRRVPEGASGAVLFTGVLDLPGGQHYEWQQGHPSDELVGQDWADRADRLGALGHPVRLLLLNAVLQGVRTAADLAALDGVGTTGQVYHHLRLLTGAGWLRSPARGRYDVPAERVVPLLTVLAAVGR